ncbi:MAG: DEAD/DEAH box helicase [Chitinophagales bacterium]|nr:DEAD/DEAH box helicase [Chitinophagales bacterium]
MPIINHFEDVLTHFRQNAFSERDKGHRFERLIQAYLQTDPNYAHLFKQVWLWNEFPEREQFGNQDTGIDLVALTHTGNYWAVQCKCFDENSYIDKAALDTFLSTSSRTFLEEQQQTIAFAHRLWVSTSNKWSSNAEQAIHNQNPPVSRVNLSDLENSPINWQALFDGLSGNQARVKQKSLYPHQTEAVQKTNAHFKTNDRGKLIMACGTGKTFTALKIAENETHNKGLILFMVPSIALLGQSLREWAAEASLPINAICICSDPEVSKKKSKNEDTDGYSIVDLALPASTNVNQIVQQFETLSNNTNEGLTVVFSTYQSIEVIAKAQKALQQNPNTQQYGTFDLIICDEAHRTTGIKLAGEDESAFVKVHKNDFIAAHKRLYMTATPRLYDTEAKNKADRYEAVLCSMDDPTIYGTEMYRIGFGEAVEKGLLTDYKVLILTLNENDMPTAVQQMIADDNNEINTNDTSKLIGCINAFSKQVIGDDGTIKNSDPNPMRRAVAFCSKIKDSQKVTQLFNTLKTNYNKTLPPNKQTQTVTVESMHVDGTMSAPLREEKLSWLKANNDNNNNECRILTNAKCLSEGVDVPSLDAVVFLSARDSQVDVVQSVGRVMRKAPNKKYGYIIIPVVIPADIEPDRALDDNDKFKVVWTVLNALRAHDDRFNATVNKIELNRKKSDKINVVGVDATGDNTNNSDNKATSDAKKLIEQQLSLQFEQLQNVLFARMVQKVGDRRYWEQWAKDVAQIAERYIIHINTLINNNPQHQQAFDNFLKGLQKNINPSITAPEAIEMLSQHLITKPVFEALFEGYSFVKNNAVSIAMQNMLDLLEEQQLEKDTETLQKFYESVKMRAAGIDNAEGKQRIIIELYDKFFKTAFPQMVEKLGIVYTPVEVVDFMIHSINDILQQEFNRTIADPNVHILDPFTGTGTFITRLLQSQLIPTHQLSHKYQHELHANEIVLLAYYIAAINIENAYHDATPNPNDGIDKKQYTPFEGICLTDTFQLGETGTDTLLDKMFPENSARLSAQKQAPLRIIMGNPPYSVGQKSANDNAQNQKYNHLDQRIADTYAKATNATNKNSLYDSYIKAFRWASDRLDSEQGGIIAFVSNGAWLDGNSSSGFRKCLEQEFSSIYVFNLRGNARTQGELRRKEAGNVFDSGSRTPIAITLLVKKPTTKFPSFGGAGVDKATIYYHDIGDYLSRETKLQTVQQFGSMLKLPCQILQPNKEGDWISVRDDLFSTFIALGDKDDKLANTFFVPFYSSGVKTQRDAWCYHSSKSALESNIQKTIEFYNEQRKLYATTKKENPNIRIKEVVSFDPTKISWSDNPLNGIETNKEYFFNAQDLVTAVYRPFFKQHLYFNRMLNERVYQMPKLFPTPDTKNLMICVPGIGNSKDFSALITDTIPDLGLLSACQCFPLYYYEANTSIKADLFGGGGGEEYIRREGVSDFILGQARALYGKEVQKEDVFYYVYGVLHSPEYRLRFAADVKKMLPRIPLVNKGSSFWAFSKAGRQLAAWHVGYEGINHQNLVTVLYAPGADIDYRVDKMRFVSKDNKTQIIYNRQITLDNIPPQAYEYVVNGKSAIEWVMERYAPTTHKDSGIHNDPNTWQPNNPKYILELLQKVIWLSVETVKVVQSLPSLDLAE